MLTRRIIPCLDCSDGRVVKGTQFAQLHDMGAPAQCAAAYEAHGADEIVLLDVSATVRAAEHQLATARAVRAVLSIPLTAGGGVREPEAAAALLEAGADKVAVNSAAVGRPALLSELATSFGRQCVVLAVDAIRRTRARWEVVTHAGRQPTGRDVVAWCREGAERGAGEILVTSWDRDGTGGGFDLELLAAVSRAVHVPVVASGGAAGPGDFFDALAAGADAALAAGIFHRGEYTVQDVKQYLQSRGVEVRR